MCFSGSISLPACRSPSSNPPQPLCMYWSGLSDVSSGCGGGHSTIAVNDPPAAALQPALHAAKSGREGGRGGDEMREPGAPLQGFGRKPFFFFFWLNKQARLQHSDKNQFNVQQARTRQTSATSAANSFVLLHVYIRDPSWHVCKVPLYRAITILQ